MKLKKPKSRKFDEHFVNFLVKLFVIGVVLMIVMWFLNLIIPVVVPFVILLTIFTIFIYPVIKIKEWIKRRDK